MHLFYYDVSDHKVEGSFMHDQEWPIGFTYPKSTWHFLQQLYKRYDQLVLLPGEYDRIVCHLRSGKAEMVYRRANGSITCKYFLRRECGFKRRIYLVFDTDTFRPITVMTSKEVGQQGKARKHHNKKIRRQKGTRAPNVINR